MRALIVVDMQRDFMPGGALPVPDGDGIIDQVNRLLEKFSIVFMTKDWHPGCHISFAVNHGKDVGTVVSLGYGDQMLWPVHCQQWTPGAEFHPDLRVKGLIIPKGMDPVFDSYSGFKDAGQAPTALPGYLEELFPIELFVCGLATDYCVKATVLDALASAADYDVNVVVNACRGVNVQPLDSAEALAYMSECGARLVEVSEIGEDTVGV